MTLHLIPSLTSLASNRTNYESIRYTQILELKNFINKQRHFNGRDVPWLLTGDFNIDAISRPAVADEYGYVYDNTSIESEEYKKLTNLLDPMGRVRDLLKECNNGEHPATRHVPRVLEKLHSKSIIQLNNVGLLAWSFLHRWIFCSNTSTPSG